MVNAQFFSLAIATVSFSACKTSRPSNFGAGSIGPKGQLDLR
ncbi:MAG: hypothetical protein ACFCA4_12795 [Cyanophyceae cyanobacterium]